MMIPDEIDPTPRPPRARIRKDHEQSRRVDVERTRREIEQIAAIFHAQLRREDAESDGAIYGRYSTRMQASVVDQVRSCFEEAVRRKIFVSLVHIYFDLATKGAKRQRPGLAGLQSAIEARAFKVLLVMTTNRLHRKTYRAMQFVEEEIVERSLRAIFVKTGVDTADTERWKFLMNFHAMMDEFGVGMYAANVRAAHEGLFDQRLVFGAIPFGYTGEPIPGEFTNQKKPRCRLVIDPVTAHWVEKIFRWFVEDRLSIEEIVHRLNADHQIPLPQNCTSGAWTHTGVCRLLGNARYRGFWEYGRDQMVWQSKRDYSRKVRRAVPLRAEQIEEFRIVADVLWYAAQTRLVAQALTAAGRRPYDERTSHPRLLNGLFFCPVHDRALSVSGANSEYLDCRACRGEDAATRPLQTLLSRSRSLQMTCTRLAELVGTDTGIVEAVIAACQMEAVRAGTPDPAELDELRRRRQQLEKQIGFVLRNVGESEADQRESTAVLRSMRRERDDVSLAIGRREEARHRSPQVPSAVEVRTMLGKLGTVLAAAAQGGGAGDAGMAREVVELLTGGRIELEQRGERSKARGWLRGSFRVRLLRLLVAQAGGGNVDDDGVEVTIDYRPTCRSELLADQVKTLVDEGLLLKEVAVRLNIKPTMAILALAAWYRVRGLTMPDGRTRRAGLVRKHLKPPPYLARSEEAKGLWDAGESLESIAARLGLHPRTALKSLRHWYESRGLAIPDFRNRPAGGEHERQADHRIDPSAA